MAPSLALWSSRVSSFAKKKRRKEKGEKSEIINRMGEAERCRKESLLRVFFSFFFCPFGRDSAVCNYCVNRSGSGVVLQAKSLAGEIQKFYSSANIMQKLGF